MSPIKHCLQIHKYIIPLSLMTIWKHFLSDNIFFYAFDTILYILWLFLYLQNIKLNVLFFLRKPLIYIYIKKFFVYTVYRRPNKKS